MSHAQSASHDDELAPSETPGYKVGEKKSVDEYAKLDANDESLAKWKASLGIAPGSSAPNVDPSIPNLVPIRLLLESASRPQGPIVFDLSPERLDTYKKNPVVIKEGSDYNVKLEFKINHAIITGLRYLQVVKRAGVSVDKLDAMVGSYGPSSDVISKKFHESEAPSGMIARSGTYNVKSRLTDDDKNVWVEFEWQFKLGKDW